MSPRASVSLVGIVLLLLAFTSTGCATVVRGLNETLHVKTHPPGAAVSISTGEACVSPCAFEIRRRGDVRVTVEKDQCVPQEVLVRSRLDTSGVVSLTSSPATSLLPTMVLAAADVDRDLLDTGYYLSIVGSIALDLGTGAALSHTPNPVVVQLDCEDVPPKTREASTQTDET